MAAGAGAHHPHNSSTLVFVYGTLKRGFYNHTLLHDLIQNRHATYIAPRTTLQSFPLVCGPHGIPYLINLPGSGHRVRGELYSVSSDPGLGRLDELEGVHRGHYERLAVMVETDGGGDEIDAAEAYFAGREFGEKVWERCGKEGLSEYSEELGKKYVSRGDRPPHNDIIQDIHNFISEGLLND